MIMIRDQQQLEKGGSWPPGAGDLAGGLLHQEERPVKTCGVGPPTATGLLDHTCSATCM